MKAPKSVIQFALLKPGAILPKRATPGAGAFDLYAPVGGTIYPKSRIDIGLGIAHQINDEKLGEDAEDGWSFALHGMMISRSGIASKEGIRLLWQGLIDHDYRGEIHVHLENTTDAMFHFNAGDRICQISYVLMFMGDGQEIHPSELTTTKRGVGGHGSTGR